MMKNQNHDFRVRRDYLCQKRKRAAARIIRACRNIGIRSVVVYSKEDAGSLHVQLADRAYEEDGSLVDRRKEGAMITDENLAVERVVRMAKEQKVTAITGKDIPIKADSVCVHGDSEKALAFVAKIRGRMAEEGIEVCSLDQIV